MLNSCVLIAQPENLFSHANRYKFGNYLFSQKDYYRANQEFRQYLRYENNDTVRFKIAFGLLELRELNQSKDYLKALIIDSKLSDEARMIFFKVIYLEQNEREMETAVENKIYFSSKYGSNIRKLAESLKLLKSQEPFDSIKLFSAFSESDRDTIKSLYLTKYRPALKSETLAGVLSALIPGAGKVYTENYSDGITAFILTSVLGYLSYNNFQHDHDVRGWIFAGLSSFFYAGNIYGSIASARIYNTTLSLRVNFDISNFVVKRNYFMPNLKRIIR